MSFIQPERRQPVARQSVLGMTCLSTLNLEELNRNLLARVLILWFVNKNFMILVQSECIALTELLINYRGSK